MLLAGVLTSVLTGTPAGAQKNVKHQNFKDNSIEAAAELPAVLVNNVGDPAALDLYYGPGSRDRAPDPHGPYKFLKEETSQTQPKFDVEDAKGVRWRVKMGPEARPEIAATRLVWAAGYFVDEDYYLDELKVENLPPRLHRGNKYVSEDGTVRGVRLERKDKVKDLGRWKWFSNPFVHTKELNGLRTMMAVVNNWDLVTKNNTIYEIDGQRRYVVTDIGSSLGQTGDYLNGTRGKLSDYAESRFIVKTDAETVDFYLQGPPVPLNLVMDAARVFRPGARDVVRNIPRADAKQVGLRLSQLSDKQIGDCFRAAGFSPEEIAGFTKTVRDRIGQLNAL
jgi:hypothetical protein